jgi:hypothetical protein
LLGSREITDDKEGHQKKSKVTVEALSSLPANMFAWDFHGLLGNHHPPGRKGREYWPLF